MLPNHQDLSCVLEREGFGVKENSLLDLMLQSEEIQKVLKVCTAYYVKSFMYTIRRKKTMKGKVECLLGQRK